MSAQANYFKLGLFVVIAISLFVGSVIFLGATRLFEKTINVETFMLQSIDGISNGSSVKYRGIELGQVSRVEIATKKYDPEYMKKGHIGGAILVELAISQQAIGGASAREFGKWLERAVAEGFRAREAQSGITGPAYIELVYLDPKEFPPPELKWTPNKLYIPSAPSTTQVLLGKVQSILTQLDGIDYQGVVGSIDHLLKTATNKLDEFDAKTINADSTGLLKDLRTKVSELDMKKINSEATSLLQEIRDSNARLQKILDNPNIEPSLEDLRTSLKQIKEASAKLNKIVHDPQVKAIMDNVEQASGDIKPALQDFRRAIRRINTLVVSQQATIDNILRDLERALRNVDTVTQDATQNPARMLFGDPPPHNEPGK